MGLTDFLLGRQVCERLKISLQKLAALCHAGKLAAYRFEDRQQILASSQCNTKFKYTDNTAFTLAPSNRSGIIAISDEAIEYFKVDEQKKFEEFEYVGNQEKSLCTFNGTMDALVKQSMEISALQRKNFKKMEIKYFGGTYIVYYDKMIVNPLIRPAGYNRIYVKLYGNDHVLFELHEREDEFYFAYLELNNSHGNCVNNCTKELCIRNREVKSRIKSRVTKLRIKEEHDSFGNKKFVLSDYDGKVIRVRTDPFRKTQRDVNVDEARLKKDNVYLQKYEDWRVYFQQYGVDYFSKDDFSFSKPLRYEVDFFVFDFDEYKRRFKFLEDEENSRKQFFYT